MDKYIPSHNYIKNMWGTFEVPELQIYCEVDCIAEPLIELQIRQLWSLIQFWMDVEKMEPNLSDLCPQAAKALFLFPTTNRCEAVFQRYNYF